MQLNTTGLQVPPFPFIKQVLRAFERWHDEVSPQPSVQLGVPSSIVQRIWKLGMDTLLREQLRDCALLVFAFCLNGLRESSISALPSSNATVSPEAVVIRIVLLKGRPVPSNVPLLSYSRELTSVHSPIELPHKWKRTRQLH